MLHWFEPEMLQATQTYLIGGYKGGYNMLIQPWTQFMEYSYVGMVY